MSNIIHDLYYGNTFENTSITKNKDNKHISKLIDILDCNEKKIMSLLPENGKTLFSEYIQAYSEVSSDSNYENFENGFRIGARFVYDTFCKQ